VAVPFITKENAAALGRKGAIATAEKWKQAQNLGRLIPLTVVTDAVPLDSYVLKRLARVRKQIDKLSDMLEHEKDPAKIDKLASAIDRLAKHEHYLAGRPGPGNRKPAPERPSKPSRRDLGATELAPQPLPVVAEQPRPSNPDEPNG